MLISSVCYLLMLKLNQAIIEYVRHLSIKYEKQNQTLKIS